MFVEWKTIGLLWPEIILVAAASAIFVGGAFTRNRAWWTMAAVISYALAAVVLAVEGSPWLQSTVFSGPLSMDPLAIGMRWLGLIVGLIFTLVLARLADHELASELLGSLMLVAAGVMLVSSANEIVLLFLGFELISIPTYVLLFLGRRDRASSEATMKYFFLSIFSSAILLFGLTLLYGMAGTTVISGAEQNIASALSITAAEGAAPLAALTPLALVLIVAGLGFKLATAPMQFYAPDVYQGTTNANAGLLAVAPKIAGVVGLVRLVIIAMPSAAEFAWQLALVLAILTMTIGNICALWQKNVRRMMAYSSIAHGGYLLIGLAAAAGASNQDDPAMAGGISAMLFYVLVYTLATMGIFAALAYLGSQGRDLNGVDELAGLGRSQPVIAGVLAICLFSLTGLPPLAGFWGKLALFGSAVEIAVSSSGGGKSLWFALLAIVGVLNSAVAAAYYLRLVSVMFFQSSERRATEEGGLPAFVAAVACAVLVVATGAFPGAPMELAIRSENQIARTRSIRKTDATILTANEVSSRAAGR